MRKLAPFVAGALFMLLAASRPHASYSPEIQNAQLWMQEAQTVYLGNLARRDEGLPPLRWNRNLTEAARWFSWDSVENRPDGYCGHLDTQGGSPGDRALKHGYYGAAGAENAFCGFVTPEEAIRGWLDSPGHHANLTASSHREVGLGYYRAADGRGYVTQDFGADAAYAPVIIENEAPSTPDSQVNVYIYSHEPDGGFTGMDKATQMMVGTDLCLTGAQWEPYRAEKVVSLPGGQGWRTVYAKVRDRFGRTATASDAIYVGGSVSGEQLSSAPAQAGLLSEARPQVTIYPSGNPSLPYIQVSPGWLADDSHPNFSHLWGPQGSPTADAAALGGSAMRLPAGGGESNYWVWTSDFVKDTPVTAYFRLKVDNNTSPNEVAKVWVEVGNKNPKKFGPLSLRGTDFKAAGQYQEFPVNFTYSPSEGDPFLVFRFAGSGSTPVWVDVVTIFSAPQPYSSPFTWQMPGGNYRGQGLWVRYTDGNGRFTPYQEASTQYGGLSVTPSQLLLMTAEHETSVSNDLLVGGQCSSSPTPIMKSGGLQISSSADWLKFKVDGEKLKVWADASRLSVGNYQAVLRINESSQEVEVPVSLIVVKELFSVNIPLVEK